MFRNLRLVLAAAFFCAAAFALTAPANALVITATYNGTYTVSCADGAACDTNATVGAITFNGSYGVWAANVDVGLSKPLVGDSNTAALSLTVTAVTLNARGGETLQVTLTDSGFLGPTGDVHATSSVGGTWPYNVDFATGVTDANGSQQLTSASYGSLPPGSFQYGSAVGVLAPYDLWMSTTLTAGAGNSNGSVDTKLTVPEPGTLAILGVGLVGLGLMRRRRRPAA